MFSANASELELPAAPADDLYVDMVSAVEQVRVTQCTIYRWIRDGEVRSFKSGRQRLVNLADVIRRSRERCGVRPGAVFDDLKTRIVSFKPFFSDDQKQQLAALLTE